MPSIRLFEPTIDEKEYKVVCDVLHSGYWDQGKQVKLFEKELAKYLGCKHVIAVNSGTAALHLALSLFKNKTVQLPALTFVSTAHACLYNGHELEFHDIDKKTLNKETFPYERYHLVLPVHFAGMPCDLDFYDEVDVVEDCAHAMGSKLTTKNIKCFSFHPVKNLAMPNGGAIALYDDEHYDELIEKRWCGISDNGKRDVKRLGWNYKLNDVNAAIGIEQLKKLDENNKKRFKIAKRYSEELGYECIMPLVDGCSYCLFWILTKDRIALRQKLAKAGIESGTHYPAIDTFSLYKKQKLPITHKITNQIVTLPIHPNLSDDDLDRIIKSCNS